MGHICITESFQKFFVFIFYPIPSPYEDRPMQIDCGRPGNLSNDAANNANPYMKYEYGHYRAFKGQKCFLEKRRP